jgi:hypothetical protein
MERNLTKTLLNEFVKEHGMNVVIDYRTATNIASATLICLDGEEIALEDFELKLIENVLEEEPYVCTVYPNQTRQERYKVKKEDRRWMVKKPNGMIVDVFDYKIDAENLLEEEDPERIYGYYIIEGKVF